MRSLLYLASGNKIREEYYSLPFDLICLVDYSFPQPVQKEGKFLLLGMDVIDAIKYLKSENLKFECLVILNEGLREGGGGYPLHTDLVLGYLMPILKDTYIHIMSPIYYKGYWTSTKINTTLDLPYEKFELLSQDEDYIEPQIFSNIPGAKVFVMKKLHIKKHIFLDNGKTIHIINDSLWNYCDDFDLIVTFFRGRTKDNLIEAMSNIRNFDVSPSQKCKIAMDVVANCNHERIAFSSFFTKKIKEFVTFLKKCDNIYPKEIYIFYLNRIDYSEIYED